MSIFSLHRFDSLFSFGLSCYRPPCAELFLRETSVKSVSVILLRLYIPESIITERNLISNQRVKDIILVNGQMNK